MNDFVKKSLDLLTRRQTSIISAAYIIMATVILSLILGLIRTRLILGIFGPEYNGIYLYASLLPDTLFQLTIAGALSSAFIPVFSNYLVKDQEQEAHKVASTLLAIGLCLFLSLSLILMIFAPQFLQLFNLGNNFSPEEMTLMANLMRIIIFGQLLFIIGTFLPRCCSPTTISLFPVLQRRYIILALLLEYFFSHQFLACTQLLLVSLSARQVL